MAWLKKNGGMLAVVLALVGVTSWLLLRNSGGVEGQFAGKIAYVCVETGKVFHLPKGVTRIPPVENPETKRASLLPCEVREDGVYVMGRYREGLNDKALSALNKAVDGKSFKVRTSP